MQYRIVADIYNLVIESAVSQYTQSLRFRLGTEKNRSYTENMHKSHSYADTISVVNTQKAVIFLFLSELFLISLMNIAVSLLFSLKSNNNE